jgi:gas vesicle protein
MKRTLLVGLLAGAALGATVLYFMDSEDRDDLLSNLKGFGSKARNKVTDMLGTGDVDDVVNTADRVADNVLGKRI